MTPRSFYACLIMLLYGFIIPLGKCSAHRFYNILRSVVFDLCVDVHGDFAALMSRQILNRFGVYGSMNKDLAADEGIIEKVDGLSFCQSSLPLRTWLKISSTSQLKCYIAAGDSLIGG